MHSRQGHRIRRGEFAFFASSCGLLLVAAIAACAGNPPASLPPMAVMTVAKPSNPPCINIASQPAGKGKDYAETTTISHVLYRVADFANEDLGMGKWVGVVHRVDDSKDASTVFAGLEAKGWGCVLFVQFQQGVGAPNSAGAFFMLAGSSTPVRMRNAIICLHPDHPHAPDVEPEVLKDPTDCVSGSVVSLASTLTRQTGDQLFQLSWAVSGKGIAADFDQAVQPFLGATGSLKQDEADVIRKALDTYGPWFPCALTGCCRGF